MVKTEYTNGTTFGTRITFTGYNFDPSGYIIPTVGINTNGHYAVNLKGCEHFGFAGNAQPTASRYFWLDQNGNRVGSNPMAVPTATWNYVPGPQPVVQAVVQVPEKEIPEAMLPDSIWMKVYVTELDRPVDLNELMSGPGSIAPQDKSEIEREWVLLEGRVPETIEANLGPNAKSVLRRYEFFKYTGPTDPTDNAPLSAFTGVGEPPVGELGDFIGANMVAANIEAVPEPSSVVALAAGVGLLAVLRRRTR